MWQAVSVLGDGLQRFALPGSTNQSRIVRARAFGYVPVALLSRFSGFALTQQYRQCPAEGVAKAVLIILRGPQAKLE
jgi:hypothetical protein